MPQTEVEPEAGGSRLSPDCMRRTHWRTRCTRGRATATVVRVWRRACRPVVFCSALSAASGVHAFGVGGQPLGSGSGQPLDFFALIASRLAAIFVACLIWSGVASRHIAASLSDGPGGLGLDLPVELFIALSFRGSGSVIGLFDQDIVGHGLASACNTD